MNRSIYTAKRAELEETTANHCERNTTALIDALLLVADVLFEISNQLETLRPVNRPPDPNT